MKLPVSVCDSWCSLCCAARFRRCCRVEKFNQAESEVAKEAGAAATVFRLTRGINSGRGTAIRKAATSYLTSAIASDWPAMANGMQSRATTEALNEVYRAVLKFHSFGTDEGLILAEILRQVDRISEARRERLVMADRHHCGIIWLVLFGGAFLTVGFTLFFGTENLRAQVLMTGALSVFMFAGVDGRGHRSSVRRHRESRTGSSGRRGKDLPIRRRRDSDF